MGEMPPYSLIERGLLRHRVLLMPHSIDSAQVASQSSSQDSVPGGQNHTPTSLRARIGGRAEVSAATVLPLMRTRRKQPRQREDK
jgi:hypothetical protein